MRHLTVVPAYGRDYKSARAVREDWAAGKDFRIADLSSPDDGRYINNRDACGLVGPHALNVRYKNLTAICVIKVAGIPVPSV